MELIYFILGLLFLYTWTHFLVVQFKKNWGERSTYEQTITIIAIVMFVMFMVGSQ